MTPEQRKRIAIAFPELAAQMGQESANDALSRVLSSITVMKGDKGDDGYTPVKGVDYFDGEDGDDYVLTDADRAAIAASIEVPVVDKVIEKHHTVVREIAVEDGREEELEALRESIESLRQGMNAHAAKSASGIFEGDKKTKKILEGMELFEGRIRAFDQRWKGGGLSRVYTDSTLTGTGTASNPLHAVAQSIAFYKETPIGAINGVNKAYALTYSVIPYSGTLIIGATAYTEGVDYTVLGKVFTMAYPLDPANFPPGTPFVFQYATNDTVTTVGGAFSSAYSSAFN